MTDNEHPLRRKLFPDAEQDVGADRARDSLYSSPAYKLAYNDRSFMLRDEMRAVRLQLEYLKPELIQDELGIEATVVIFGSARFQDAETSQQTLANLEAQHQQAPDERELEEAVKAARKQVENSVWYEQARRLGRLVTENGEALGACKLVVVTGGGPGIMEAANRGAHEAGGQSIGLNIVLPAEQQPNAYITPELCFQFHYFALRKMHFLMRARALVAFPGGFGTLDELFETLTLIQTHRSREVPIILVGETFWRALINFDLLLAHGTISQEDMALFSFAETAEQAWDMVTAFYAEHQCEVASTGDSA